MIQNRISRILQIKHRRFNVKNRIKEVFENNQTKKLDPRKDASIEIRLNKYKVVQINSWLQQTMPNQPQKLRRAMAMEIARDVELRKETVPWLDQYFASGL